MNRLHIVTAGAAITALASSGFAQIPEIEPNDTKATATHAPGLVSGDYLDGNSILGTAYDYWRVSTAPAPLGIYRHEFVLTTTGTVGHVGTLRGLNQTGGVPGVCPANGTAPTVGIVDTTVQTSSTASVPPRMNAWYGFGKGELMFYRVAGTATTLANYNATLTTTAVAPISVPGTFAPGPITVTTVGQTTADTDIALYDSNLNIVMSVEGSATNDDEHCHPGTSLQSWLTRTLAPGTYYLAIGGYDTGTSHAAPTDEDFMTGVALDFPRAIACNTTGVGADRDFQITDGATTYTSAGVVTSKYFEIRWAMFTVGGGGPVAFCEPGVSGVMACPCLNPPSGAGRGCNNSETTGGASIFAAGNATLALDTLTFTTANQTAFGTTILMQGTADNGGGVPFGQGVRCVDGALLRLYVKSPGGAGGILVPGVGDPSVSAAATALGDVIVGGQHRYYMAYYRDPVVLGGCPPGATFNGTNAQDVIWN
jgi:hypothetical protein